MFTKNIVTSTNALWASIVPLVATCSAAAVGLRSAKIDGK